MVEFARKLSDLLQGTRRHTADGVEIVTTANGTTQVSSGGGKLALQHLEKLHNVVPDGASDAGKTRNP